ncbi:MAG: aminotransferase class I/II-fold pyridoxal phosphate-dependent enzyme, partial [Schaalia hyovaginalis]|uniref:aminotransferase class I/II-fold pyridoxal phosphate-dependent enzyme n=1 Tax=Schaalia hyovaginalis TaxID=29316 RepID=UPI002A75B856
MSELEVPIRPAVRALPRYAPGKSAEGAVKLSSNEMPLPPSAPVAEAMRRALETVNRYPDLTAVELRGAIAARHGVDADQVCVGTGSSALLVAALGAVCEPGDRVVYPWRSFESYPIAIPASHGVGVPVAPPTPGAPQVPRRIGAGRHGGPGEGMFAPN